MTRFVPLPGLLAAVCIGIFGWAWLGREVPLPDVPTGRLQCLSYAPTSPAGSPLTMRDGTFTVPEGLIAADVRALSRYTNCLRSYSMLGSQGDVLAAAAAAGITMHVGIWIGPDDARNAREINRTLELAHAYPGAVRSIVVGNEVLLRREMTGERLAGIVRGVKSRTHLPVAYADIYEFWRRNPAVAQAADVMLVHVLPYWDDPHPVSIDAVQDHVRGIVTQARQTFPGKPIVIGEIGWPSAGRTRSRAAPSRVNQARFVRELAANADTLGVGYNLIEAIDQPWKHVPEGTVGAAWGLLDAQRRAKFPLTGPVSEWPHWRWAAAFTAGFVLLAFVVGRRIQSGGSWLRWMAYGVATSLAGAGLWALGAQVASMAMGLVEGTWGVFLLGIGTVGSVFLLGLLLVGASPWLVPTAAPAVRGLRGLLPATPAAAARLFHAIVLFSAAVVALQLAADGRHRDFLTLAYWPSAATLALLTWRARLVPPLLSSSMVAWLSMLIAVCGVLVVDHPGNREALAWAVTCLLLGASGWPAVRHEALRMAGALRSTQQQ